MCFFGHQVSSSENEVVILSSKTCRSDLCLRTSLRKRRLRLMTDSYGSV